MVVVSYLASECGRNSEIHRYISNCELLILFELTSAGHLEVNTMDTNKLSCGRVASSHAHNPAFGRGAEYR